MIGRFVDVTATLDEVIAFCDGRLVARHRRSWAAQAVITDPDHVATAARLRRHYTTERQRWTSLRRHTDGHPVALRSLPDYDALFGVDDFTTGTTKASSIE